MNDMPAANHPRLTAWEMKFLDSIRRYSLTEMTPKQVKILEKIKKKCAPPKTTVTSYDNAALGVPPGSAEIRTAEDIEKLIKGL